MPICNICGMHYPYHAARTPAMKKHRKDCQDRHMLRLAEWAARPWWKKLFTKRPQTRYPSGQDPLDSLYNAMKK